MKIVAILADGFLPTRGSVVLDFVFVAMFAICAVLVVSILMVRVGRKYTAHRNIQISLAVTLAIAITVFEIDVRLITDWRALAEQSRFYDSGWVDRALWIHLAFAIPTPFVWAYVVVDALKKFPAPLKPGDHGRRHRIWGRIAAVLMFMTAITGCAFYWLAFAM